jgi:kinesin family protein 6/9
LAGSERVNKSQVDGNTLLEAKHINLSLTYLEQVIIALHEKKLGNRNHVPYRNSLMTTILRDSLGGNCKTVMIATLSTDIENIEEDLSTSRFAQRCSQLVNEVFVI